MEIPNYIIQRVRDIDFGAILRSNGFVLKGSGDALAGPCPRCGGRDRFAVSIRKRMFNCRGCGAKGCDAIALMQFLDGVNFREAVEALISFAPKAAEHLSNPGRRPSTDDQAARTATALEIWREGVLLVGTPGERYLVQHRGLDIRQFDLNHALRWHPGIGAMIALMTDAATNEPLGIHRTFLDNDARKRERKMRGRKGTIRLSADDAVTIGLGIVEGVEDGLAVLLSGWNPVWCAADAGSVAKFPVLPGIEALTIFADADRIGMQAAKQCADRWIEQGLQARIFPPAARARHV